MSLKVLFKKRKRMKFKVVNHDGGDKGREFMEANDSFLLNIVNNRRA
jgi:hypothetical protein